MAALIRPLRVPQCRSCLHSLLGNPAWEPVCSVQRQTRGKKKEAKEPRTVKARLLKDMRGYGKQGSIIPVAPGRMRNIWYPRRQAEYVTHVQLQSMRDMVIERDHFFGVEEESRGQPDDGVRVEASKEISTVAEVQIDLLSPEVATALISQSVPEHLDFYRKPIIATESEKPKPYIAPRSGFSASSAAADLAAASEPPSKPEEVAIFGSVSTADIVSNIKALLADTEEGARVVLSPEDVAIVREGNRETEGDLDIDRIKMLGDFQIGIRVKGGSMVRKVVRVKAAD